LGGDTFTVSLESVYKYSDVCWTDANGDTWCSCWYRSPSSSLFQCSPGGTSWDFEIFSYLSDLKGKTGTWKIEILANNRVVNTKTFYLVSRTLRKFSGDGQTVTVANDGTFKAQPLKVQLMDGTMPHTKPSEAIAFAITSSPKGNKGGSITSSANTDSNGIASADFTPGSKSGSYTITATSQAAPDTPQTFTVNVTVLSTKGKTPDPLKDADLAKNHGMPNELECVGNPINVGTGNKYQYEHDYSSADSFPLIFDRHYNSDAPATSSLGGYWRGTYDRSIVISSSGKTQLAKAYRADGKVYIFTLLNGLWQADPDVADRLYQTATGWRYVQKNNQSEEYDANGRLIKLLDQNGLTQQLEYNAANQVSRVSSSFGSALTFNYDASGKLTSVIDPANNTYQYSYDAVGNLTHVTYPDNSSRQYLYEDAVFPHALTGIINENNVRFATWHYDSSGRAISSEHAGGAEKVDVVYNSDGSRFVSNTLGQVKTYFAGSMFGSVKVGAIDTKPCFTCAGSSNINFSYDSKGFLNSAVDANNNTNYLSYNERGLKVSQTQAAGTAIEQNKTIVWHETRLIFRLPFMVLLAALISAMTLTVMCWRNAKWILPATLRKLKLTLITRKV
jgi:YD repeat-containing protein